MRAAALVLAILAVTATVSSVVLNATWPVSIVNTPAHVIDYLSNGTVLLDVPLMTFYTAPAPQAKGFETNMSFAVSSAYGGPSTAFRMRWGNVTGSAERVRFRLTATPGPNASTVFGPGPEDGFLVYPAGAGTNPGDRWGWSTGLGGSDISMVYHEEWRLNYTVVRIAQTTASVEERWIQIDYTLEDRGAVGEALPAANTTLPGAEDLVPFGGRMVYNVSQGSTVSVLASARDIPTSLGPFRHNLPPVTINAGSAGTLSAVIGSEFAWGPADGYWLGWTLTAQHPQTFVVQDYVDIRFGSIVVRFLPAP